MPRTFFHSLLIGLLLLTGTAWSQAQGSEPEAEEKQPVTAPTPAQDIEQLFEGDSDSGAETPDPNQPVDPAKMDPILYIVDSDNGRVVVMQSIKGTGYTSLGMPGFGIGRFLRPSQIWIDYQRRMYVADTGNNRVIRIDKKTQQGWTEITNLSHPQGVAVDGMGVYVSDTHNDQVLVYDELADDAKPRETITHSRLKKPTSLWIDKEGALYICCGEYPPGGYVVKTWMDVDEPTLRRWKFYEGEGLSGTRFFPTAVITDEKGIKILDSRGQRIIAIRDIKGQRAKEIKLDQDPRYRLRRPTGLAIDHRGFLFVADSGNDRVLKLSPEGEVLEQFFILSGDISTMLANPTSIFIHSPAPLPPPPEPEKEGEDDE